jgi:hypothetical protein
MQLYLDRFDMTPEGTTGMLRIDAKPLGFTIERPWKDNQKSISCIPSGKYKIKFREDPTPLTMHYRQKYDFFKFHLELQDVKDRSGIYIHVANYPKDVEGCIGVAASCGEIGEHKIYSSRKFFKKLYLKLKAHLDKDEPLWITIDQRVVL